MADPLFSVEHRRRISEMIDQWQPLCDTHNVTSAQLITAWTAAQPGLTHVLCGIRTVQQARENAAAGDLELTADELKVVDDSYERYLANR
jgi:aryl-alcohol dehydrogenase-like predicted oxidoreductase